MKNLLKITTLLLATILMVSCGDDLPIDQQESGIYTDGYFITNEGPFSGGTGTITYVGNDETIVQNAYQAANNNEVLGSIVQSMTLHNDKAYIVINNAHKVVVANRHTLEKIAILEGDEFENPRSIVVVGNTGYVSNWGDPYNTTDDTIIVINLEDNTVTSTISVEEGPEDMLIVNNKIYVNLQGGYGQNDKVVVIDTNTNTVTSTITVSDVPNSILRDDNGAIWVLCGGNPGGWAGTETKGQLFKIENDQVSTTFEFATIEHPNHLTLNNNDLIYTLAGKVYATTNNATALNTTALDGLDGNYYSMKAKDNKLYTTDAGNYTSEGTLKVFDLSNNSELNSITTGIIPGSVVF